MGKEALFTLKLEADLRDQFMAEAQAAQRPASQIVRELMGEFVRRRREDREHDAWFRAQVLRGLHDADDPDVAQIPREEVISRWRRRRADLAVQAGERAD